MYNKHSSCHVNSCTPVVGSQRAREAAAKCEGDGEMWEDVGRCGGLGGTEYDWSASWGSECQGELPEVHREAGGWWRKRAEVT